MSYCDNVTMRIPIIVQLVVILGFSSDAITNECAIALQNSTKIHWKYVEGTVTATEDINAYNKALRICNKEIR